VVDATEGRCSARVGLEIKGDDELPDGVHLAVYRITQEALNNVVKHAHAANVWVKLDMTDHSLIRLVVGDDGRGFERRGEDPSHMGLTSMEERAHEVGADLLVRSHPGEGTVITLVWRRPSPAAA
jgi:signal transduction histidine kinase